MSVRRIGDVEIGEELPEFEPDVSLETVRGFANATGVGKVARFTDHERARKEGLPGAIVPGVMSQGILAAMLHRWAPGAELRRIDTIFRLPILADSKARCRAVVTSVDLESACVEIDLELHNEAGETSVLGTATLRLSV